VDLALGGQLLEATGLPGFDQNGRPEQRLALLRTAGA